jgi:hypothetical protein
VIPNPFQFCCGRLEGLAAAVTVAFEDARKSLADATTPEQFHRFVDEFVGPLEIKVDGRMPVRIDYDGWAVVIPLLFLMLPFGAPAALFLMRHRSVGSDESCLAGTDSENRMCFSNPNIPRRLYDKRPKC